MVVFESFSWSGAKGIDNKEHMTPGVKLASTETDTAKAKILKPHDGSDRQKRQGREGDRG